MRTDHFQPVLASNAASFTSASPTFTPDGSRLAWADKDGVHFANTSDLGSCSPVTDELRVAGAAYPFFGKADMSTTAGVSQTATQGAQSAQDADGEIAVSMVAQRGRGKRPAWRSSCGAEIAGVSPCRPPRPGMPTSRARIGSRSPLHTAADSRDVFRTVGQTSAERGRAVASVPGRRFQRGQRRRDGDVHQAGDASVGEGASARPALSPRSPWTTSESADR